MEGVCYPCIEWLRSQTGNGWMINHVHQEQGQSNPRPGGLKRGDGVPGTSKWPFQCLLRLPKAEKRIHTQVSLFLHLSNLPSVSFTGQILKKAAGRGNWEVQAVGISPTAVGKKEGEGQGMVLRANRPRITTEYSRLYFKSDKDTLALLFIS